MFAAIYAMPILGPVGGDGLFSITQTVPDSGGFSFPPLPYTAYNLTRDIMIVSAMVTLVNCNTIADQKQSANHKRLCGRRRTND